MEKSIKQSDLEYCESADRNNDDGSDSKNSIRRINSVNTPYQVAQETTKHDEFKNEHLYSASANEIDEKKPKLKNLPQHLEYAYLHGDKSFPIIISSKLSEKEKMSLLQVLEKRKRAIAWKMSNIKGISRSYCTHKILMEDDYKLVIQPQRRLNQKVQDVVKNEIVKLFDSGIIYLISDSSWVRPIHVVPKKGGMTIVLNDNNELIPSRTELWIGDVCIDYHKLNDATRKDHFPLPFIDQMLERLYGNEYYCFLDGFSGFFKIPISPEDQEKTTFTCPYGTFAYRRMPFGLCNAPATFQRCMTKIFHDMVEDFMEVFMDDFSVFGFDIEIKDKKGAENLAADYLSRLENPDLGTSMEEEITDEFPDEHLMILKSELNNDEPWYADYVIYIVGKIVPPNWTPEKRRRFFSLVKNYFWDEPYAFKLCSDNVMRRCVAGNEIHKILAHFHSGPTGGHHSASITRRKVYESGFYWPSIFKDAKDFVMRCNACQRSGNISSRSEMPQNNIQVEAQALPTNDARIVIIFLRRLFARFGVPKALIKLPTRHLLDAPPSDCCSKKRFVELNELMELRDEAYENTRIYKERTKRWHDSRLRGDKNFKAGDRVLLFNSRFKMHPGKLKSKWYEPNVVKTVYPYGTVEIIDKNGISFKVNGQRLKKYHDGHIDAEEKEVVELDEDAT
ncbi:reverse transcriptase domain-containing protein [Tanacetum coccineum]|uniref:Reverse transcriptase domain-containing protein n=1 Tax=Tanacetum coccineum TaxID=301880 RepID=A0ABQ4YBR1_9ASTR